MSGAVAPPARRGDGAAPAPAPDREAIYLFAFVAGAWPEGAADQDVTMHRAGAIAALASVVPLAEYCGAAAERDLGDPGWLAPRARRHAGVIARAMQASPVFPAPFGTLYTSWSSLTAFMRRHEAAIVAFLRDVAGKEEWALTASARPGAPAALEAVAGGMWPDWPAMTPGTRYLRLCRERPALIERARARARQLAAELVADVRDLAGGVCERALPSAPGEGDAEPVASYALLVPAERAEALRERVAELGARAREQQMTLALSGPWPPFSFRPSLQG